MNIYYLGPEGSFTENAALQLFDSTKLKPSASIEELLNSVKSEEGAFGIVPLENTLEGVVIRTLDHILENKLKVVAEISTPIVQNLLSKENSLQKITKVYSHPYAIAQSNKWLKRNLQKATIVPTESTSKAAEIAETEPNSAAIASRRSASLYNLNILKSDISNFDENTNIHNITRFWVVSCSGKVANLPFATKKLSINTKTSYYIIVRDKVGALKDLLEKFQKNFISLTSIQSRPLSSQPWKYGFFIDLLTDGNDPLAKKMLSDLKRTNPKAIMLGTYPQYGCEDIKNVIIYNEERINHIFNLHNKNWLLRRNISYCMKPFARENSRVKKIISTRLLVVPSVAYYKQTHNLQIENKRREKQLLRSVKKYDKVNRLHKRIIEQSKKLQYKTIKDLGAKKITPNDIVKFSIKNLRYYIDYLDKLIVAQTLNETAKQSSR